MIRKASLALILLIGCVLVTSCSSSQTGSTGAATATRTTTSTKSLTVADAGSMVNINQGDILQISLQGNPSTGYAWEVAPGSGTLLAMQGESEFQADSSAIGSGGTVTLRLLAVQQGEAQFKLIYHRSFEPDIPPLQTFEISLNVGK